MDFENLNNDELLKILKTSKDKKIRIEAVKRITDEEMLIDISLNYPQAVIKKTAIEILTLKIRPHYYIYFSNPTYLKAHILQ